MGNRPCLLEESNDLYYFSGLKLSAGMLLFSPKESILFVDGRYLEKAKQLKHLTVIPMASFDQRLQEHSWIVFDSAKTSVELWQERQKKFPKIDWIGEPNLSKKLRAVKDAEEQKKMRISAEIAKKGFHFAVEGLRDGVSEKEIAWRFERFCREQGAEKMSFEPIVAFGENSAFPHHRASSRCLNRGDTVLIDVGCVLDGYASDMTRTIPGTSPEIKRLHSVVENAAHAALKKCKAGISIKELDQTAREEMRKEDLESFFTHGLGHGIGLETHEYPRVSSKGADADDLLEEGMVITIEPGLYMPGVGGVRREDTIIVKKGGIENFYGDLP